MTWDQFWNNTCLIGCKLTCCLRQDFWLKSRDDSNIIIIVIFLSIQMPGKSGSGTILKAVVKQWNTEEWQTNQPLPANLTLPNLLLLSSLSLSTAIIVLLLILLQTSIMRLILWNNNDHTNQIGFLRSHLLVHVPFLTLSGSTLLIADDIDVLKLRIIIKIK